MSVDAKPLVCPKCNQAVGLPFSVTSAGDDQIKVDVRCSECGHEWRVEMKTQPIIRAQARPRQSP